MSANEAVALRQALERAEHDCPDCEGVWWIRGEGEESDTTCWNPLHRAFHHVLYDAPDAVDMRERIAVSLLDHVIGPGGRCVCGRFVSDGDFERLSRHVADAILVAVGIRLDEAVRK